MPFDIRADLPALKSQLQNKIDAEAGTVRASFITVTGGQEMVYLAKQAEALAIVADIDQGANVPDGETPHVTAEAVADQVSRFEKAVEIITVANEWALISPLIETTRLQAKAAIAAASSAPAARDAAQVNWTAVMETLRG